MFIFYSIHVSQSLFTFYSIHVSQSLFIFYSIHVSQLLLRFSMSVGYMFSSIGHPATLTWIFASFSLCPFLWSSIQPIFVYSSSTTSILFYHWTSWTLSIKWQYERFAFAKWKRGSKVLTYFLNGLSSASASFIFALFKQTIQIIQ